MTRRVLSGEATARAAAPFVAVAPTAIWIAVSADGYYAGIAAWGIALLALATRDRHPILTGAGAGLLLGWGIFLNYGLGLMAIPAVAVLITAPDRRTAVRVLAPATVAALAVVGAFAATGFWWFDGYTLVQQRYWQGIAMNRQQILDLSLPQLGLRLPGAGGEAARQPLDTRVRRQGRHALAVVLESRRIE